MTKKPMKATEAENGEIAAEAVERPLGSDLDNPAPTPAEDIDLESRPVPQAAVEAIADDPVAPEGDPAGEPAPDAGGDIEAEEVTDDAAVVDPVALETGIVAPEAGPVATDPASELEGNQPDTQQAQADQGAGAAHANQSEIAIAEDNLLAILAIRITDMLDWRRADLIANLTNNYGMVIERSLDGTRVSLAGITVSVAAMGPGGERQALDNWANAARRRILELQAVAQ